MNGSARIADAADVCQRGPLTLHRRISLQLDQSAEANTALLAQDEACRKPLPLSIGAVKNKRKSLTSNLEPTKMHRTLRVLGP